MSWKEGGHNMKKTFVILAVGIFLAMAVSSVYATSTLYGPTELIYYDASKAYKGYTSWSSGGYGWMVDMEGNLVHKWEKTGLDIYPDGHRIYNARGSGSIQELDWDGNVIVEWTNAARPEIRPHHDRIRIFNESLNEYTILAVVSYRDITYEEALANGSDPENNISEDVTPYDDGVIEFDRAGNLIWEWRFWDHIIQNYDATKLNYGDPAAPENWGRLDINRDSNTRTGLSADWNHVNSLDYNQHLDQVVVNSREHGEIYFIDHSLTTEEAAGRAGDFVYRWGNPANYYQGDWPTFNSNGHEQLFGAHDIQWIADGLTGAGNLLIFENGSFRPGMPTNSKILEFNPYQDGDMMSGVYVQQHDAGYTETQQQIYGNLSNQVVWGYASTEAERWAKGMYSSHISGTQRLPNGNTLICAGEEGHFVEVVTNREEVTAEDEVVWEYVNPVVRGVPVTSRKPGMSNSVFRAYRYGVDYSGYAGLDLSPKGPITESTLDGAMDKFRESKTGFSGGVVILPGGDGVDDPYYGYY